MDEYKVITPRSMIDVGYALNVYTQVGWELWDMVECRGRSGWFWALMFRKVGDGKRQEDEASRVRPASEGSEGTDVSGLEPETPGQEGHQTLVPGQSGYVARL